MSQSSIGQVLAPAARGRLAGGLLVVLLLTLVAAGCAPSATSPAAQPAAPAGVTPVATTAASAPQAAASSAPAAGDQAASVAESNNAFAPKTLTVTAGTTVMWTNQDSTAHTITADNGAFDSGNQAQGATFKFTFAQPGTYSYYCRYHGGPGGAGMAGQIIVK